MIEHLRGRDRKLEPLGWTGQHAEWIALVCLHSDLVAWIIPKNILSLGFSTLEVV